MKGSGLVRPILQPRFVPWPWLCTGGAVRPQGQTGQSDTLTMPHSVGRAWRLPFWKLRFLLPEADGEREWRNGSGSHWAQVLDSGSNYNNKVKLSLIIEGLAGPCLTLTTIHFVSWHYCSHFIDAKQVHMHIICVSPHLLLKVAGQNPKLYCPSPKCAFITLFYKNSLFLTLGLFISDCDKLAEGSMQSYFW